MKSLQIVLMGWEYDRIIYGIKQRPCNKVIFISSNTKNLPENMKKWGNATSGLAEKIREEIKPIIKSEMFYTNYHSLDDCLEDISELLEKAVEEFEEISVNISSGTTILKMAFMLAAQYYPLKLFYVIPKEYSHPGEIITVGARGLVELPSINLSKISLPKNKRKEIFLLIEKEKKSFTEITKAYAKKREMKIDSEKMKSLKSWIFYHLKKLEEQNLIETKTKNKELFISLTQTGRFINLVLKHKKEKNKEQTKLKIKRNNNIDV